MPTRPLLAVCTLTLLVGCVGVKPVTDAGADSGTPVELSDGGTCMLRPRATPEALAASPRSDPALELQLLHAAPWLFVVDDGTWNRAVQDKAIAEASGAAPMSFIPSWNGELTVYFDDAGFADARNDAYHDWDCLNAYYRTAPPFGWSTLHAISVRYEPVINVARLASDYAELPHVLSTEPHGATTCLACWCDQDSCLDLSGDAGTWRWFWVSTAYPTCEHTYYRMISEADGGAVVETWSDAGLPVAWLDEMPRCWNELFDITRPDGG